MNSIIISAMGSDRPGIVSELCGIIRNHGGNVEDSRMSKMGSDFAIIMLISVSKESMKSLEASLFEINNLIITTKSTDLIQASDLKKIQIDLKGADNEGIIKVLTDYFTTKSVNIVEMNTHITQAPVTGYPLFNLVAIMTLPVNITIENIKIDLESISQKLCVEIVINEFPCFLETV